MECPGRGRGGSGVLGLGEAKRGVKGMEWNGMGDWGLRIWAGGDEGLDLTCM